MEIQSDLDWGAAPVIARPTSKGACKNGDDKILVFKNQGRCMVSVQRAATKE